MAMTVLLEGGGCTVVDYPIPQVLVQSKWETVEGERRRAGRRNEKKDVDGMPPHLFIMHHFMCEKGDVGSAET
jgi:hypothetical protein